MPARAPILPDDPSLGLALAMVCSSPNPLLLLDGAGTVIAASVSFCEAFDIDPADAVGQPIFALGSGEWDRRQLRSLVAATASGDAQVDAYELDLSVPGAAPRSLVLNVRKLDYGGAPEQARLIVAITDVTAAKAASRRDLDLAHDNAVLLKEVRHRIANSLQIIASVMMLNARRTPSEEARGHLRDAHNRVMSMADLQQQLAVSADEDVAIRDYLTKLCVTITASMIAQPENLSIHVTASDARIDAEVSVSLGLIVTELVINALKHGFPEGAGGRIDVCYACEGPAWTLSVADTGVGMPKARTKVMAGLGTSIVQALARQLGASVVVTAATPGTKVAIVHTSAKPEELAGDPAAPQIAV